MDASRRSREAVKASGSIAWWVGTCREVEARANAARRHLVAYQAHQAEGNHARARTHLDAAELLAADIKRLQAAPANERQDLH